MSQPFYLGDLTGCATLEATIDAITNLGVDGASDYLVGRHQLAHLAEMHGLAEQADRHFWYRFERGEQPPERAFPGWVLDASDAGRLAEASPGSLDGRRLVLRIDGVDLAALTCRLRELGVAEVAVQVDAATPEGLLAGAAEVRQATGLPLHLAWTADTGAGRLEEVSMALGYLLERGGVRSLTLGRTHERPGSGFARSLFNALELKRFGINYVSCPTCGRCRVDLEAITNEVKERTKDITAPLTVAIMGCEVNGPGEARHADIGIASGTESGLLIRGGEAVAKYQEKDLVDILVGEIRSLAEGMEV